MICIPESVPTISLSPPTGRPKVASSKGFCICPRENSPRSPPFWAELQSLSELAIWANNCVIASCPLLFNTSINCVRNAWICAVASSFDWVMLSLRQLAGRRDPLCFLNMWLPRTYHGWDKISSKDLDDITFLPC